MVQRGGRPIGQIVGAERHDVYGSAVCRRTAEATSDPRAMRRYVAAEFSHHPVVAVRRERLGAPDGVREGSAADLDLTAEVDGQVRGADRVEVLRLFALKWGA